MNTRLLVFIFCALLAGCSTARPSDPESRGDVLVDGVSILGAWQADEVVGDAGATARLRDGAEEQVLVIRPNGRLDLVRGDGTARSGRVTGNRVAFAGEEGAGTLLMSGRRLVLRDASGRSTVFARTGG